MAEVKNEHYSQVVERMSAGKDSVFEIGEVTKFDPKTLTASILGLRTKEVKENVIVTFPNFFMNSGLIIFPVNKTRGLLYVGPDNQNFFLPAQFHLPHMDSDKDSGKASLDASPERIDPYINFSDFEQGEFLYRHLKGSQLVFRNNGAIEMVTNKAHGITIDSDTGEYRTVSESIKNVVGYSTYESKVVQPKDSKGRARHIVKLVFADEGPEWKSVVPIPLKDAIENLKHDIPLVEPNVREIIELELVNVLDEDGNEVVMETTGVPLLEHLKVDFDDYSYDKKVDKNGRLEESIREKNGTRKRTKVQTVDGDIIELFDARGNVTRIQMTANQLEITIKGGVHNKIVSINNDGIAMKHGNSSVLVKNDNVEFKSSNGSTSINDIINWMKG